MAEKRFALPDHTTGEEIKRIRKELGLTQKEFGEMLGVSRPTMERWEKTEEPIKGPVVFLLHMMENHIEEAKQLIVPKKQLPLRLWYMYQQKPCTMMDVDEMKQELKVVNFTDHVMFRAFGNKTEPTYEDFTEFLESRCFPRERDKMKIILKELKLPFYDPMMIIEKTEGRMAEDAFWIKIER